jgi:hypothetical protein
MNNSIEDKLDAFSKVIIVLPVFQRAIDKILHSVDVTKARQEPSCALLLGAAGTGKTTVCRHVIHTIANRPHRRQGEDDYRYVPVLFCSVPADCTIKKMAEIMLLQLGSKNNSDITSSLEFRIKMRLLSCKTVIVILDEFHHLLKRGAEKTRDQLCDWVKSLINETLVPFILVGEPNCEAIITSHEQLSRRYPYRARLFNLAYDNDFKFLLAGLLGKMVQIGELQDQSFLSDELTARRMYVYSGGNLEALRILLFEAFLSALTRNRNSLSIEDCISGLNRLDRPAHFPVDRNVFEATPAVINKYIREHLDSYHEPIMLCPQPLT